MDEKYTYNIICTHSVNILILMMMIYMYVHVLCYINMLIKMIHSTFGVRSALFCCDYG